MTDPAWIPGSCHCGIVKFRVRVEARKAIRCNCSICAKKGFINLIVAQKDFELLEGEAELSTYRFNTGIAQHKFCRECGIHPFTRPRSHPDSFDVNLRCLEVDLETFDITPFDGQNWEESVASIR